MTSELRDDRQWSGDRCEAWVIDPDETEYWCILPVEHHGWHLDTFRMVDAAGNRLQCELRWSPRGSALDDVGWPTQAERRPRP